MAGTRRGIRVRIGVVAVVVASMNMVLSPSAASPPTVPHRLEWVDLAATPAGDGYWITLENGHVEAFGRAVHHGDRRLEADSRIVGIAATPDGSGYWLAAEDGGVFTFGSLPFYGSAADLPLVAPIVDIEPTPSGRGYWLLGADGGIFTFGDAAFLGRPGRAGAPAVALSATRSGGGYFVAFGNGGPTTFGDAVATRHAAVTHGDDVFVDVAYTHAASGAWLVDFRGEVSTTRDGMKHHGGTEHLDLQDRITAMTVTRSGEGYWLLGRDGGVFTFGDARFYGSGVGDRPVRRGIHGYVSVRTGNCMPRVGGDDSPSSCRESAAPGRRVWAFTPPLESKSSDWNSTYYTGDETPTAETVTGEDGRYGIELPAGDYTVLVEDDGRRYCSGMDGSGRRCLVRVGRDAPTRHDIVIDHAAY